MNIRDVQAGAYRPDQLRSSSTKESEEVRSDAASSAGSRGEAAAAGDRVEISDQARTALTEGRKSSELQFARKALLDVPPLSEERMAEILDRITEGYYQKPEVVQQIAQRLTNDAESGGLS